MDLESVHSHRSGHSDRSYRSHRSRHGGTAGSTNNNAAAHSSFSQQNPLPPPYKARPQPAPPAVPHQLSEAFITALPSLQPTFHQQTQDNLCVASGLSTHHNMSVMMSSHLQQPTSQHQLSCLNADPYFVQSLGRGCGPPDNGDPTDGDDPERLEVQIMPQDDEHWGETTTALTGATSDTGVSVEDMARLAKEMNEASVGFDCARNMGVLLSVVLGIAAFASPIVMVVIPQVPFIAWKAESKVCDTSCEGQLLSFSFKLLILLLGTWGLFFRGARASMPRVFIFRSLILFFIFMVTFAFWLFYGVRILVKREENYGGVVQFASSLVDALLFVHYLAIVLLEIRHLQTRYAVKVLRSPDGEARIYLLGEMSIQRAAVQVLQNYTADFPVYNPYLENAASRHRSKLTVSTTHGGGSHRVSQRSGSAFKIYDIQNNDANDGGSAQPNSSVSCHAQGRHRRSSSHGSGVISRRNSHGPGGSTRRNTAVDRFYDECEYERRVQKRRVRLLTAAEEAFTHIRRRGQERTGGKPMDPHEAAQAVFPTLLKPLQKYLRITRQQPRYSMDMILSHLATCLCYDLSPRAFVERYFTQSAVIEGCYQPQQGWTLICDHFLSRSLDHEILFTIRSNTDVTLLCTVHRLPFFSIAEEVLDLKQNRFVLRLNSETSV